MAVGLSLKLHLVDRRVQRGVVPCAPVSETGSFQTGRGPTDEDLLRVLTDLFLHVRDTEMSSPACFEHHLRCTV